MLFPAISSRSERCTVLLQFCLWRHSRCFVDLPRITQTDGLQSLSDYYARGTQTTGTTFCEVFRSIFLRIHYQLRYWGIYIPFFRWTKGTAYPGGVWLCPWLIVSIEHGVAVCVFFYFLSVWLWKHRCSLQWKIFLWHSSEISFLKGFTSGGMCLYGAVEWGPMAGGDMKGWRPGHLEMWRKRES